MGKKYNIGNIKVAHRRNTKILPQFYCAVKTPSRRYVLLLSVDRYVIPKYFSAENTFLKILPIIALSLLRARNNVINVHLQQLRRSIPMLLHTFINIEVTLHT